MKVVLAEHAGACYGVQRALDMAGEVLRTDGASNTLGPLIHNPQVVANLEKHGLRVAESVDDVSADTVIIRSHGVTPQVRRQLEDINVRVVDATCPHVLRAQKAAEQLAHDGCRLLIVGEPGHPEVSAIRECARIAGAKVDVVLSPDDIPDNLYAPVGVVIQTTQRREVLDEIVSALQKRNIEPIVRNTICSATSERQLAAARLAEDMDAMVVIGGKNSSNTTRLAEICRTICPRTFHIESDEELSPEMFSGCKSVGVTAGASTPSYQISQVVQMLDAL
ncbi:4-hydroxy-3-methylbut-2-enyl diphosphate reductase [Adlercreutzia sp. ZJ304]|uniref:4-hydroxy-3-methylbut-2-enyl diphosphate reductase n=1 Tax=Adlercreutzia sp. ZJ304 TaxID=2709791 RepID=UPI0013EB209C|nr:4-hydroxy-3-methylbut-2-enyl diphosphate reductase [Adlercreutzia sp. ZJ304]